MRLLATAAISAAAVMAVSSANALSYVVPPNNAGFTIGGDFTPNPAPITGGSTLDLNTATDNVDASAANWEFDSLVGNNAGTLGGFTGGINGGSFAFGVGGQNAGITFSIAYDRANGSLTQTGDGLGPDGTDNETGVMTFVIGATTFSQLLGASVQNFTLSGLMTVGDGGGVYDDGVAGSFTLSGTFTPGNDTGSYSLSIAVPPDNIVSEPAIVGLIGAGLVGLVVARRRV